MRISIFALLMLSGCATIMNSGPDVVNVDTNPRGARVYLNGLYSGVSPINLTIHREDDAVIDVKLEGYEPVQTELRKTGNGWIFGNLLIGGGLGVIIDLASYNQGGYFKPHLDVTLVPLTPKNGKIPAMPAALPPDCSRKPTLQPGCFLGKCVNGEWEQICSRSRE